MTVIKFEKLHFHMQRDPFYGVATELGELVDGKTELGKAIYAGKEFDHLFLPGRDQEGIQMVIADLYSSLGASEQYQHFLTRYLRLPCKNDTQRLLLLLWCGLVGLPARRNGLPLGWGWEEFLDEWKGDFELRLEDVRELLRKNQWPLPFAVFPEEPDTTQNFLSLSETEYNELVYNHLVVLPELESELSTLVYVNPQSLGELDKKKARTAQLKSRISSIHAGNLKGPNETPKERKNRLERWLEEEKQKGHRGAIKRTAAREGISRQFLSEILNRPD